ncbi:MAG: hypothetical protein H7X95_10230, partial [Deltaproteobacteria bacterium]|nr:hypothetical protein [Deltaproteobacteria bacterium]
MATAPAPVREPSGDSSRDPSGDPSGQTLPSPEATETPQIIRRVDNPDMRVAFTFDACATSTQAN